MEIKVMETLDYKQIIKDEINFYLGSNNKGVKNKINYKDTPILNKMSLNYSEDQLKEVIGRITNQIDSNFIIEGMVKGHFNTKKIERYKITYENNIYNQDDYPNDIRWISDILKNIPLDILKSNLPDDFVKKAPNGAGATKASRLWENNTIFLHRNWLLGNNKATGKDETNVNKNKLINKIKEKFDILKMDIKIDFVGYKIERTLGKYKETIYEYNNS